MNAADERAIRALIGVDTVAPGGLSEDWRTRRERGRAIQTQVERAVDVAVRAVELARRISLSQAGTDEWENTSLRIERLYDAANPVAEPRPEKSAQLIADRTIRMCLLDALQLGADHMRQSERFLLLDRLRLGERIDRASRKALPAKRAERAALEREFLEKYPVAGELATKAEGYIRFSEDVAVRGALRSLARHHPDIAERLKGSRKDMLEAIRSLRRRAQKGGSRYVVLERLFRQARLNGGDSQIASDWSMWRKAKRRRSVRL